MILEKIYTYTKYNRSNFFPRKIFLRIWKINYQNILSIEKIIFHLWDRLRHMHAINQTREIRDLFKRFRRLLFHHVHASLCFYWINKLNKNITMGGTRVELETSLGPGSWTKRVAARGHAISGANRAGNRCSFAFRSRNTSQ